MPRRIQSYTDSLNVTLECGHHVVVGVTSVFTDSTIPCVWDKSHGRQKWITFDGSPKGYNWKCKTRLCGANRKASEFLLCRVGANSHRAQHGHTVEIRADDNVGLTLIPETLDGNPPF